MNVFVLLLGITSTVSGKFCVQKLVGEKWISEGDCKRTGEILSEIVKDLEKKSEPSPPLSTVETTVTTAMTPDNAYWRFRGVDSYVMVKQEQVQNLGLYDSGSLVKFIGFEFLTKQQNELFFLVGSSIDQFYALELKDGTFVLTYNFGFSKPRVEIAIFIRDYSTAQRAPVLKFYFIPPQNGRTGFVVLLVNNQLMMRLVFGDDWNMRVTGSVWIGGIHQNNQFAGLSSAVQNVHHNFRGCITQLKLHVTRGYQIYNADERVGVTIGCTR